MKFLIIKTIMKKVFLLITLCFSLSLTYAQSCNGANQLTLLGKKSGGIYHQLGFASYSPNNADPSQNEMVISAWTCNSQGYPICNFRIISKFILSQIPANAYIVSANLYLYAKVNTTNGITGSPTFGTNNAVSISRIISPWDSVGTGLGWLNQPQTTTDRQVIIPTSTSPTQNYITDIKNLVQYWVNNPDSNFGMQFKIANETYYNSMIFHSGTSVDAVKPRLEICYWTEEQFPKVWGYAFYDANGNGVKDSLEYPTPYTKVQLSNGTFTFSDINGYYEIAGNSFGAYNVDVTPPTFYSSTNLSTSYNFTSFGQSFQNNIPFIATSNSDSINVHITPFHRFARMGFGFPCYIDYENLGNTVLNPSISVGFDSNKQTYDSCSNASFVNIGNIFGGPVGSINPGERHYFIGYLTTKPTVSLSDTIQLNSIIAAGAALGIDAVSIPVSGSFDPNDKEATAVLTPAEVASGKYIDYTIRFENIGNDTAINIVVKDTLSNLLQANTLQMISSSHTCKVTVKGNKVKFEFKNINLLYHSLNELKSVGFVKFRVKPLSTLTNGTSVNNKASIYFDFNEPIVTNVATTRILNSVITPVKISNYELQITKESTINIKQVLNAWTTVTETNTGYFNVQRSIDGKEFATVGKINAKGIGRYEFTDPLSINNLSSTIYYRLEIVDMDGGKTYSQVKQIGIRNEKLGVSMYPNPAKNEVTIERKLTGKEHIAIADVSGKIILTKQLNSQIQTINISSLSKGVYIISFENGDKMKLIKN